MPQNADELEHSRVPRGGAGARISALAKAARRLVDADEPEVAALGRLLDDWLASGADGSLDVALGLRQRGGVSLRRSIAIADRDAILCRLMAAHPDWRGLEPTIVARRMRKEFERYEAGRWLRERDAIAAPSAEPFASFWRLLRHDLGMPKFDRLREILANGIQSPV